MAADNQQQEMYKFPTLFGSFEIEKAADLTPNL